MWWNIESVRRMAVVVLDVGYALSATELTPHFDKTSSSKPVKIVLTPILLDLTEPTDLQPIPGTKHQVVLLQKGGQALWADLKTGESHPLFSIDVVTESEQGLLGLAFAPDFSSTGRFYVDYTRRGTDDYTVIQSFTLKGDHRKAQVIAGPILLEVKQPYQNHNAGQLSFGPDGMLYVSMGDGGYANDPHQNGQNQQSLLGTILRLDVSNTAGSSHIPEDNPILPLNSEPTAIWAYGLRNPWRFSWDPKGRLIVADVGQDKWEEIHLVESGDNLGWNRMEGFHCFPPDPSEMCDQTGLVLPIYEYDHAQGNSITGGYVSIDPRMPELLGQYIFGDFVRGRLWAIELPDDRRNRVTKQSSLGKWPLLISSFGRDGFGYMYILDYAQGRVLRIDPPATPEQAL